ncbi:MAG: HD domain-containing protein [Candidatus Marinimicrobia bacterium]|nr:HD domain-containing protein [Candidatus Neomarinimicrobiota bacterium]
MATDKKFQQTRDLISSIAYVYQLKSIPRTGWLQAGIQAVDVESIAGHSFGMSILILYLRPAIQSNGINVERCLNMAMIHDIAEAIVGDLTPLDGVLLEDKHVAEANAFDQIVKDVQEGKYFKELWEDFETANSAEAMLVKRIDKLDMLIQAFLYEKKFSLRLDSFWENMDQLFKDSESESIYKYILSNRFELKGN